MEIKIKYDHTILKNGYYLLIVFKDKSKSRDSTIAELINVGLEEYQSILKKYGALYRDDEMYFIAEQHAKKFIKEYLEEKLVMAALIENT